MEEMSKSLESPSPPPTSLSSLPYDIVLNCLARISIIYHPTLSLVSKSFRTILSSRELHATRSRVGKAEDCIYVCLNPNKNKPDPRWFALSAIPGRQKLIPIRSFPYQQHPIAPSVLSVGTEIYIIGGFVKRNRSRRVFLFDCRSHQWRRLPDMHVVRRHPAADVIDGKIYVIRGNLYGESDDWGEVYDPKTQTWEKILETSLDLTIQQSVRPGYLVMGGKVYSKCGGKCYSGPKSCLVELDNVLYRIFLYSGELVWIDRKKCLKSRVSGLEGLIPDSDSRDHIVAMANPSGGRRVTVWWKTVEGRHYTNNCKTKIWCAEISFERRSLQELRGFVEWSKSVFTFDGCNANSKFFLHSAIVTH